MENIGRNDPCPCGSGKKYKKCCLPKEERRPDKSPLTTPDWGYAAFGNFFLAVADQETRSLTILDGKRFDLPNGVYVFHEMYCVEHGCDCRRVFFYVTRSARNDAQAVICYGWEPVSFYREWFKGDDIFDLVEIKGPALNSGSPQSIHAPAILELVRDVLLRDGDYIERLKRHYRMFKARIEENDE